MDEFIKLFNNDLVKILLGFLISLLTAFFTAKLTLKNSKKTLTTQHFKENAVGVQVLLLNYWIKLSFEDFNISYAYQTVFEGSKLKKDLKTDVEILKYINELSYTYCSAKSISNLSAYLQFVYKNLNDSSKKKKNMLKRFYCPMALISSIIVSLKFDFTGEKIDAVDILKANINDLSYKKVFLFRVVCLYYRIIK